MGEYVRLPRGRLADEFWRHGANVQCIARCLEEGRIPRGEVWNRLEVANEAWHRIRHDDFGARYHPDELLAAAIGHFVDRQTRSDDPAFVARRLEVLLAPLLATARRRHIWRMAAGASVYELVPLEDAPAPPTQPRPWWRRWCCHA